MNVLADGIRSLLPPDGIWTNVVYRARHMEDGTVEIADWWAERTGEHWLTAEPRHMLPPPTNKENRRA